jgi:hypothetical protein
MNEEKVIGAEPPFEGKMFLYEKPELLTKEEHGGLGLSSVDRTYDFVKSIRAVPIVTAEVATAQKHFPIVFAGFENPTLLAVVGAFEDRNLFVNEDGTWDQNSYLPTYLRCYPFAFATRPDDQFAVVIDRSAAEISDKPEQPFFDGDKLSVAVQARVDFCGQFDAERRRTKQFCERANELGLLSGQRATHRPDPGGEEKSIANYVAIDVRKLNDLDKDTLQELHQDGSLSAIFGQVFSVENWGRLVARHALMRKTGNGGNQA